MMPTIKPRMGETRKAFEERLWQERTKWVHRLPGWFARSVREAHKLGLVGSITKTELNVPSACLNFLQCDPRFRYLLDHCGGEAGVFICEPYLSEDEIRIAADALGEVIGCSWSIVPGGNTWGPGTTRVEFRQAPRRSLADVSKPRERERRPNGRLSQGKSVEDYVNQIKRMVGV